MPSPLWKPDWRDTEMSLISAGTFAYVAENVLAACQSLAASDVLPEENCRPFLVAQPMAVPLTSRATT
jgi:hypothetical protein